MEMMSDPSNHYHTQLNYFIPPHQIKFSHQFQNLLMNTSYMTPLLVPSPEYAPVQFSPTTTSAPSLTFTSNTTFTSLPSLPTSLSFDEIQTIAHEKPNGFHGSAFQPPSKCAKHSDFPATIKQESSASSEKPQAQEHSSCSTSEEGRTLKKAKSCPVCGLTIRSSEYQAHLQLEIDTISKITRFARPTRSTSRSSSSPGEKKKGETRWSTYQKVRANRQKRATAKVQASSEETTCPVCNIKISGTPEELNQHADECLKKQRQASSSPSSEEHDISVDTFEEYEWAGQTRIRATSLLDRGFTGFPASKYNGCDDDQQDLNVDGDDSLTYGNAQYSEADVIPCSTNEPEEDKQREALRNALVDGKAPTNQRYSSHKWSSSNDQEEGTNSKEEESTNSIPNGEKLASPKMPNNATDRPICLICMEGYTTPLVSISCWHVHCEECWLRTLGAKKLCPQCNLITSPRDLRRIYL